MSDAEAIGYLKGKIESIEKAQESQSQDTRRLFDRVEAQGRDVGVVKATVEQIAAKLDGSDSHPALVPTAAPAPDPVALQVLKHPASWMAFVVVALLIALIVVTSALTGRDARTLTPTLAIPSSTTAGSPATAGGG